MDTPSRFIDSSPAVYTRTEDNRIPGVVHTLPQCHKVNSLVAGKASIAHGVEAYPKTKHDKSYPLEISKEKKKLRLEINAPART